jgi:hypothetical protein
MINIHFALTVVQNLLICTSIVEFVERNDNEKINLEKYLIMFKINFSLNFFIKLLTAILSIIIQ